MENQEQFLDNQHQIEEILFQLHQGNFKFAEKLINIFKLDCFEKKNKKKSFSPPRKVFHPKE